MKIGLLDAEISRFKFASKKYEHFAQFSSEGKQGIISLAATEGSEKIAAAAEGVEA